MASVVEELYLTFFSRLPTDEETEDRRWTTCKKTEPSAGRRPRTWPGAC